MHELRIKRIYEPAAPEDGFRILVDRLWPRGVTKETAKLDLWARNVAPSSSLRQAFHHETDKMAEFRQAYKNELEMNPAAQDLAASIAGQLQKSNVTLLYGARDKRENNAVVLMEWLNIRLANI
jgi:uncharacterized protein YeaO (DUF488 family)